MLELYLNNSDLSSLQESTLEDLEKAAVNEFYYNDCLGISRIEQTSDLTGDVLREFSAREVLDFQLDIESLVKEKRKSDNHFLGMIEAAKESIERI